MGCVTSKNAPKQKNVPSQHQGNQIPLDKAQSQKIKLPILKLHQLSPSYQNFLSRTIQLEKNIMSSSIMIRRMDYVMSGNLDHNTINKSQSVEASD